MSRSSGGTIATRRRHLSRRTGRTAIGMIAITLLISACGSASNKTTPEATGSKSPIVIGGVITAASFPGVEEGFKAKVSAVNSAGGIDGHQIKFVGAADDGNNSSTNLSLVQRLINSDHVAILAPVVSTVFLAPSAQYAESHKTPFSGWGFVPTFCGSKWGWGFNGCLSGDVLNGSLTAPLVNDMGEPSSIRVAQIGNDNQTDQVSAKHIEELFKIMGAKPVANLQTVPTSGNIDYSPYVKQLLDKNPNLILISTTLKQAIGIVTALKAAGYKGRTADFQTYVPGLLKSQPSLAAALEGEYIDTQIPPQEQKTPAITQMTKDLVAIGQPTDISLGNQIGYWTASVVVQMLKATSEKGLPVTGANLEQTVNAGFTYKGELEGGVGDTAFPKAETEPTPCAALMQIVNGEYKVAQPFKCYKTYKSGASANS